MGHVLERVERMEQTIVGVYAVLARFGLRQRDVFAAWPVGIGDMTGRLAQVPTPGAYIIPSFTPLLQVLGQLLMPISPLSLKKCLDLRSKVLVLFN